MAADNCAVETRPQPIYKQDDGADCLPWLLRPVPLILYAPTLKDGPPAEVLYYEEGVESSVSVVEELGFSHILYVNNHMAAATTRMSRPSHELIARRMLDFPSPVIISVFDQGRLFLRRSNLPGVVPAPSAEETQHQRTAHAQNEPQGGNVIRCWPVHEAGWKREILRREVEDVFY